MSREFRWKKERTLKLFYEQCKIIIFQSMVKMWCIKSIFMESSGFDKAIAKWLNTIGSIMTDLSNPSSVCACDEYFSRTSFFTLVVHIGRQIWIGQHASHSLLRQWLDTMIFNTFFVMVVVITYRYSCDLLSIAKRYIQGQYWELRQFLLNLIPHA